MFLDIDLSVAVDVIWFSTWKNTRRDVSSEVQSRLAEVGLKKLNSCNKVHSKKVPKCENFYRFFPKFPCSESNILWCGDYTYSEFPYDGIAFS